VFFQVKKIYMFFYIASFEFLLGFSSLFSFFFRVCSWFEKCEINSKICFNKSMIIRGSNWFDENATALLQHRDQRKKQVEIIKKEK